MSAPREALFAALFAKLEGLVAPPANDTSLDNLSTATPLRTASRTLRSWDDCPPADCPAAFLTAAGEQRVTRRGLPSFIRIRTQVIVYVKNDGGRDNVPSTALNAMISAMEDKLKREPTEGPGALALFPDIQSWGTTLGGLCYTCSIGDSLEIFEGFQGADSIAVIPIDMLTTDA